MNNGPPTAAVTTPTGSMFAAITSVLIFLGDPRAASGVLFWLLGGLGRAQWVLLPIPALALGVMFL